MEENNRAGVCCAGLCIPPGAVSPGRRLARSTSPEHRPKAASSSSVTPIYEILRPLGILNACEPFLAVLSPWSEPA